MIETEILEAPAANFAPVAVKRADRASA